MNDEVVSAAAARPLRPFLASDLGTHLSLCEHRNREPHHGLPPRPRLAATGGTHHRPPVAASTTSDAEVAATAVAPDTRSPRGRRALHTRSGASPDGRGCLPVA